MSDPIYDVTLAAIPGDNDHHPRCPWADEEALYDFVHSTEGDVFVVDCICDALRAEDDEDAAYRRYEEGRK